MEHIVIEKLVTLCISRDIQLWKKNAPIILEKIESKQYDLVVPHNEVTLFKGITPIGINVISEEAISPKISAVKIRDLLPERYKKKSGWYLQQILKIEALRSLTDDQVGLIWDSDTIPLKKLGFINSDKTLNYYVGQEFHPDYFATNNKLVNIGKVAKFSFISQCFPIYGGNLKALIQLIESSGAGPWYEIVAKNLQGSSDMSFSEYELMGSYLFNSALKSMRFLDNPWSRDGRRIIKSYRNLNHNFLQGLSDRYDFIAVEGGLYSSNHAFYIDKLKNILFSRFRDLKLANRK